jgi:hypothetical protein
MGDRISLMVPVASAFRWNFAALITALAIVVPVHAARSLSVKDVMKRAEGYVDSYGEKASIVVCTERYEQQARTSSSTETRRTLVSDFALVFADAIHGWLGFRDVLEIDGRRVGDREDRLAGVLMASQGRYDEARRLSDESARFNIGSIQRNFNVPTTTLFFFLPDNHDRFKFSARRVADDGTWEIAFKETRTPTLIRTPEGDSVHSSGTIWVRPDTGVIVRTLLQVDSVTGRTTTARRGHGQIDVSYKRVEALNMWLPAAMEEEFEASRQAMWDRVTGHAEYSNYREFTTAVRIK